MTSKILEKMKKVNLFLVYNYAKIYQMEFKMVGL